MQTLPVFITKIPDFFYDITILRLPKVRGLVSRQFFRYGACGSANMVLDWVLYFLIYNFVNYFQ